MVRTVSSHFNLFAEGKHKMDGPKSPMHKIKKEVLHFKYATETQAAWQIAVALGFEQWRVVQQHLSAERAHLPYPVRRMDY